MKQQLALLVLYYLRFFARLQLRKNPHCQIIGITGSAGKSSTRNAIYSVLKQKFKVKASFKANSESGIPLDILGLEMRDYSLLDWLRVLISAPWRFMTYHEKFDYYVVEMGIDSPHPPKNMDFLLSIIRPKIAVFLGANLNHSFAFDQLVTETAPALRKAKLINAIATEKAKLILTLPKDGLALLNCDDENVRSTCQGARAKIRSFGFDQTQSPSLQILSHQVQFTDEQNGALKTSFTFRIDRQQLTIEVKNCLLAKHYGYSLATAILVGLEAGLAPTEIKNALENQLELPAGRATVLRGKNQSFIIDSSYNASSMRDMIELVAQIPNSHGRKLALLGDMRELGDETQMAHEEIATLATKSFAQVFLVGQAMSKYAYPIIEKNHPQIATICPNSKIAGQIIAPLLAPQDIILVKGSQNTIFLEEAIKAMLAKPEDAERLCRQSPWWLEVKRQAFAE